MLLEVRLRPSLFMCMCQDLGFSPADRAESVRRVGELSCLFNDAGTVTIVSLVSPYRGKHQEITYIRSSILWIFFRLWHRSHPLHRSFRGCVHNLVHLPFLFCEW